MAKQSPKVVPFEQVIAALLDNNTPFSPTYLHRFSDLSAANLKELKKIWPKIDPERRSSLISDLEDLTNHDTIVCFDEIGQIALKDPEARVRAGALNLLWECDDKSLVPVYINMMQKDPDEVVRATAASGLGIFVYLGELEEIPSSLLTKIDDVLLETIKGKDTPLVHRRALESLGYSSRDEVPELFEKAINMTDEQWQASALFAMGRSADSRWEKYVLQKLAVDGEVQLEAARAAGELELKTAREPLLDLLTKTEELDNDLRNVIIWSLSKIGGENVRDTLEKILEDTEEDEEIEFIQNALDNLKFTEGIGILNMLDIDPEIAASSLQVLFEDSDSDKDSHSHRPSKN